MLRDFVFSSGVFFFGKKKRIFFQKKTQIQTKHDREIKTNKRQTPIAAPQNLLTREGPNPFKTFRPFKTIF